MRRIVHLSDLHFGRTDRRRVAPLLQHIEDLKPHIVIISGDLTQRATEKEFVEAKEFIDRIKQPTFVLPGNHDIPLYNLFKRFNSPFHSYSRHISPDLSPFYADDEIAIIGINTVRNSTISSGRINKKQIAEVQERMITLPNDVVKLIVSHHPFDLPSKDTHHKHTHKVVGRSKMAMRGLAQHGADLFLAGHLHVQHIGDTTRRYSVEGYSGLIVQAGTAISTRARGEPVSFNVLHLDRPTAHIESYAGSNESDAFVLNASEQFIKTPTGWQRL